MTIGPKKEIRAALERVVSASGYLPGHAVEDMVDDLFVELESVQWFSPKHDELTADERTRRGLLCRMAGNIAAGVVGAPPQPWHTDVGNFFVGPIPASQVADRALEIARAIIEKAEAE